MKAAAAFLVTSMLAGCDSDGTHDVEIAQKTGTVAQSEPDLSNQTPFSASAQLSDMTDVQRNSINMLNYLVVLMERINSSENGRMLVADAYDSLINNIAPNAVDDRTLHKIEDMLDTLEDYRMVQVKRACITSSAELRAAFQHLSQFTPARPLRGSLGMTVRGSRCQSTRSLIRAFLPLNGPSRPYLATRASR